MPRATLRKTVAGGLLVAVLLVGGFIALGRFRAPRPSSSPTTAPTSARATRPSNVVLVSLCSVRADRVGAMGGTRNLTPNVDRLAQTGTSFMQAYTQGLWSRPSHYALLTSRYPTKQCPPLEPGTSLANALQGAGYQTAGFTGGAQVSKEFGFSTGFDVYEEDPEIGGPQLHGLQFAVSKSLEWLDRTWTGTKPFFLFVQTFDTHPGQRFGVNQNGQLSCPNPADPVALEAHRLSSRPDFCLGNRDGVYYSRLPKDLGPGRPENLARENARLRAHAEEYGAIPITDAVKKHLEADYDASIRDADAEIGRLIGGLEQKGLREKTLVIVLGDHGWDLFEQGFYTNGRHGYETVAHVPLVVAGPGMPKGAKVEDFVGLIDIAPTLVDLLGLPYPPAYQGASLTGVLARNPRHAPTYAVSDTWIRSDGFELVVTPRGRPIGLYDLRKGPREQQNLVREPALADRKLELRELYLRVRALSQPDAGVVAPPPVHVSEKTRRFMRKHGYWDKNDKETGR